jgi:hypothetical protein
MSAKRYCMAAQKMNIAFDSEDQVVVGAVGDTLQYCLQQMARNLEPLVGIWPEWDLTLAVGDGASDRVRDWMGSFPRGAIGDTSGQVVATGPFYMSAQPLDDDGNRYGTWVKAKGETLRKCFSATADNLEPAPAEADLWDFSLDVGEPAYPHQWD